MVKNIVKTVLGCNVQSLIQLFSQGFNSFLLASQRAFTAAHTADTYDLLTIPHVPIESLLNGSNQEVIITVGKKSDGMLPYEQALALLSIVVTKNPKTIVEVGTFLGHTTKALAQNARLAHIHTLDLPENFQLTEKTKTNKDDFHLISSRSVGREFIRTSYASRITQHYGDSKTFDFTTIGAADFFFIDGSHTYEYCKNDSNKSLAIAEDGAIFIWHDCDFAHPGVVKFIKEWRSLGRNIVRIEGTPLAYYKK